MTDHGANASRFDGSASTYHAHRLSPPPPVLDFPFRVGGIEALHRVVDLGCGSGLTTLCWADRAEAVLGIEPNEDMLDVARSELAASGVMHVSYQQGFSDSIDLPDRSVDLVSCGQAFHWMDPTSTLAEVSRVLRPDGMFLVYDCEWPLHWPWPVQQAWKQLFGRIREMERDRGLQERFRYWPKSGHLRQIEESGHFRFTNQCAVGWEVDTSRAHVLGLARSQGQYQGLRKEGVTDSEMGFDELEAAVLAHMVDEPSRCGVTYTIRYGIR